MYSCAVTSFPFFWLNFRGLLYLKVSYVQKNKVSPRLRSNSNPVESFFGFVIARTKKHLSNGC